MAFAVKVEQVLWCAIWRCAPISIWGDIAPKSEKIAEKWHFFSECPILLFSPIKSTRKQYDHQAVTQAKGKSEVRREGKNLARVRAARAFQQQCWFFAVTSVTLGRKMRKKNDDFLEKRWSKKRVFLCCFIDFSGGKRWYVKIHTKTNHNPLYYRGLRSNVWHLWQQK